MSLSSDPEYIFALSRIGPNQVTTFLIDMEGPAWRDSVFCHSLSLKSNTDLFFHPNEDLAYYFLWVGFSCENPMVHGRSLARFLNHVLDLEAWCWKGSHYSSHHFINEGAEELRDEGLSPGHVGKEAQSQAQPRTRSAAPTWTLKTNTSHLNGST